MDEERREMKRAKQKAMYHHRNEIEQVNIFMWKDEVAFN